MLSILGVLLIIGGLFTIAAKFFGKMIVQIQRFGTSLPTSAGIIFLGMILMGIFYAEPGHSYKVYYPFNYPLLGSNKIVNDPGFSFNWWGQTREFQNEIVFKYIIPIDSLGTMPEDIPDNIYYFPATDHEWEFADAVKAHIGVSIVVALNPYDKENFSKMVDDAKFEDQLVHGRLIPDINTAIKNTCKLMYAQEYISGEAANFDSYLKDQLENGSYQLEPYYSTEDQEVISDSLSIRTVSKDGENKKGNRRWKIKEDPTTKTPLRKDDGKTSLSLYHLTVRQAVSDNIDWEKNFDNRLDKQKALVAETQLEKQGVEKAVFNQKKLFAEGEAAKTGEKARLEKDQIQQTIAAETAAKVAGWTVQEEKNLLEAAGKRAQRIRLEADAQSEANAKMVSAGLPPEEKAKLDNARAIGVAAELAKITFPEVYIAGGGQGGQDGLLSSLISAEMARQILAKKEK